MKAQLCREYRLKALIQTELPDLMNEKSEIKHLLNRLGIPEDFFRRDTYLNAIKWLIFLNTESEKIDTLSNPYEPLIMLYERGGTIRRERQGWEICSTYIFIRSTTIYQKDEPFVELNHASLDQIDGLL